MKIIKLSTLVFGTLAIASISFAGTGNALIGWHKFEQTVSGNNNGGVQMNYATYNAVVAQDGSLIPGSTFLNGKVGSLAGNTSNGLGFKGVGITNSTTIGQNDSNFGGGSLGNGEAITNWGDAPTGANAWKFGNAVSTSSGAQLKGDIRIVNATTDKYFRIEFMHFDARGRATENSPNELQSGNTIHTETWTVPNSSSVEVARDISISLAAKVGSQVYIAPGDAASFRFVWGYNGLTPANAQAQLDNIALEGTFFDDAALTTQSIIVPEPSTYALLIGIAVLGLAWNKRRQN
jgi:hypothetical protein